MENGVHSSAVPHTAENHKLVPKAGALQFHNRTVHKLPSRLRLQPLDTGMAELQFSPASVNFKRPGELDRAQFESSHTL